MLMLTTDFSWEELLLLSGAKLPKQTKS